MEESKKVLQMTFATTEGGTFRISVANTKDDLTAEKVKDAMDVVVSSGVFETSKGAVIGKAHAQFITQETQKLEIA